MFAIVKIAGKQFKVEKDQTLYVPKMSGDAGSKVEFSDVVMADNNGNLTFSNSGVKISAEILSHVQGDKVIAYKQKRRKGFRKKKGHRTQYTKIRINDIA
jgi:large subunit ribosomal protein L21